MKSDPSRKILIILIVILGLYVLFFPPFELQLRSEEPRRAVISMEMIFTGDYLKPQIHGWKYYNKPPLFNWIMVAFMQLFHSFDEWVVRLPGLLSHALLSVCLYFVSRKYLKEETALLATLFYFTSSEILFYGSVIAGQIDLFYTWLVFMQLYFLFDGIAQKKTLPVLASYFFLAIGVLTKGVPSVAFQVLTLAVWLLLQRRNIDWFRAIRDHLAGGLLAILFVAGYFVMYQRQGGDALIYLINLFNEASQKSGFETSINDLLKSLSAFPLAFLKLSLPWVFLGLFLFSRNIRQTISAHPLVSFSVVVIAANLLLYWVSGYVTTRYLFPFVPFISILLAHLFTVAKAENRMKYFYGIIQGLIVLAPLGLTWFMLTTENDLIQLRFPKVLFAWLVSAALLMGFHRFNRHAILLSVLVVLMLKLYSQWTYYPDRYADERIHSMIAQIPALLRYSDGNPIFLLGNPEYRTVDVSLGKWSWLETSFSDPMPLSYQLPYYIEREQRRIMEFHTSALPGHYYLVRTEDIDRMTSGLEIEVLYGFEDDWKRIPLSLIKT
jgi:4-amino-4-deoxy-L-arabinose transferase-like glycosyltransferase